MIISRPKSGTVLFHYNRKHNVVITQPSGQITLELLVALFDAMRDENLSPGYCTLGDYRTADFSSLASKDLAYAKKVANERAEQVGGTIRFAMWTSNALNFGMGRMYQMSDERVEVVKVGIFQDYDEALSWLGVEPSIIKEIATEAEISLD